MEDAKTEIIEQLYNLYKSRGYITEDEIFDLILEKDIPFFETNSIMESLLDSGVFIKNEYQETDTSEPFKKIYDASQLDYYSIYEDILMEYPGLKEYVNYIKKIVPAQRGEWKELIIQAKSGNLWANKRLIEMNLRSILNIAWSYHKIYGVDFEDVLQDGYEAVLAHNFVESYDLSLTSKFTNYLCLGVKNYIDRKIEFNHIPSLYYPTGIKEKIVRAYEIVQNNLSLCTFLLDDKIVNAVMSDLKCSREEACEYILFTQEMGDLQDIYKSCYYNDMEEILVKLELKQCITEALSTLPAKLERTIRWYYGIGMEHEHTLEEIGKQFSITRERVRQMVLKALNMLKHPARTKKLRTFVEQVGKTQQIKME